MTFAELQDGVFTLDPFLDSAACEELIRHSEAVGYEAATITTGGGADIAPDIRNNARLIEDDFARAQAFWLGVRDHVPPFVQGRQAIGVNERFRFYRYDPGERFAGHLDAPFRRETGEQSLLTFMVYLNDNFAGGETAFRDLKVVPKTGLALLFRHNIFHEGMPVRAGRKYVLRSDVMFNPPGRISQW
jgi:hypothetical protein